MPPADGGLQRRRPLSESQQPAARAEDGEPGQRPTDPQATPLMAATAGAETSFLHDELQTPVLPAICAPNRAVRENTTREKAPSPAREV